MQCFFSSVLHDCRLLWRSCWKKWQRTIWFFLLPVPDSNSYSRGAWSYVSQLRGKAFFRIILPLINLSYFLFIKVLLPEEWQFILFCHGMFYLFLFWDIITPKNRYVQIFLIGIIFWAQLPNFPPSKFPWKFRAKYEYMENINIGSTKNVKDVYLCMVRLQWVFMFSVPLHKDVSFKFYKFKNFYSSLIFCLHLSNCYLCNLFLF